MRPEKKLIWTIAGICVLALGLTMENWNFFSFFAQNFKEFSSILHGSFYGISGCLFFMILLDAISLYKSSAFLKVTRHAPASLSLGEWSKIELEIHHSFKRTVSLVIHDLHPSEIEVKGLPFEVKLQEKEWIKKSYQMKSHQRGDLQFGKVQVLLESPFGFWQRSFKLGSAETVKVLPNFAAIRQYFKLASQSHTEKLGIKKKRQRGDGTEFHQLREYIEGDSLKRVDWKASARRKTLISREYQLETNQNILFLVDCGHRMRSKDGMLSHFDHALNAILLMTHVALRQGDSVGLMNFGSSTEVWLLPKKGNRQIHEVLNQLYHIQPETHGADFQYAAEKLFQRFKKRALVVVISNIRGEETEELNAALHLLRKRHVLLFANMREVVLDHYLEKPVSNFDESLIYLATTNHLAQRESSLKSIREKGIFIVDEIPSKISIALVNTYHQIKAAGQF